MEPPTSRSQIDKLGKRLSTGSRPSDEDRQLFSTVLDYYQAILDDVAAQLIELGHKPTTRVKTTGTLVEKLARETGIQLTRINDIAGARIVVSGTRKAQDDACASIAQHFGDCDRKPQRIDRRADPRQGYRALHLIVYPGDYPVEIQIRTTLQDSWAQIFERLADQWGRQIRYGGAPDDAARRVEIRGSQIHGRPTRSQIVAILMSASKSIDIFERLREANEKMISITRNLDMLVSAGETELKEGGVNGRARLSVAQLSPPDQRSDATSRVIENYLQTLSAIKEAISEVIVDRRRRRRVIRRSLRSDEVRVPEFYRTLSLISSHYAADVVRSEQELEGQEREVRQLLSDIGQIAEEGDVT